MEMAMKPVYMINGFLESGKTEFIKFTLEQPYFKVKGKTLLLLCEEGELEYENELLAKLDCVIEVIEEEGDFTPAYLLELEKKHKPERIIVEYNGMWNFKNMHLPWHWKIEQQITIIDGSTFSTYYMNMRSLLAEMLKKSEMIIFNRCDDVEELGMFKRNVKAINQQAEIIFEDKDGEIEELLEEELPYDLHAEIIELDNKGYGIWYLDFLDHMERYEGKKIRFTATVMKPKTIPEGYFVPGRMAMTCCADDMVFLGFACKYDQAKQLSEDEWVEVTAEIHKEYWDVYEGEGPILYAITVKKAKKPKDVVIDFS